MHRTQIQFPDPLFRRLKQVADMNDWPVAEVVRRATEAYVERFPESATTDEEWVYPEIDAGGDYLIDPADIRAEADALQDRER